MKRGGVNCLSLNPGGVPTGITKDLSPEVKAGKFSQIRLDRFENSRADIYEEMTDTPDLCWVRGMASLRGKETG
jgi:hypothetical protein